MRPRSTHIRTIPGGNATARGLLTPKTVPLWAEGRFITSHIHAGTRHDGHPYAWIDWESAVTALDGRRLSCTGSEAGILRIAASPGHPAIPVHLARVLGSLDHTNIALVTTAITRANG